MNTDETLQLNICHLYPDLLNLYGDRGNIIALRKRCQWRGIAVTVKNISMGEAFDSSQFDLIFIGGGQDYEQEIIRADFLEKKGSEMIAAINNNKVCLAICGGYQMLGHYYKTADGKQIDFLGALDLWTIGGTKRLIGNMAFRCEFLEAGDDRDVIVGFENHSGRTYLGQGLKPMGTVVTGNGNNGEDGFEGAIYKNTYCSYSHGSLLPKNPALSDFLIRTALQEKYHEAISLKTLDDRLERTCHDAVLQRLVNARA